MRSEFWKKGLNPKGMQTYIKSIGEQLGENLSEKEVEEKATELDDFLKDHLY